MLLPTLLRAGASCAVFSSLAFAQQAVTDATLTGRILDPAGAPMAHTRVTATETATNQSFTADTDARGRFRIPYLPAGHYTVRTQPAGMATAAQTLDLTLGAAFDLTFQPTLVSLASTVEVTAAAPILETDRSQVAETVRDEETRNLPLEGRNSLDLALLLPGVSPTNTGSTQTLAETSPIPGQGFSINSQRNLSNSFVIDGLSANDDAAGLASGAILGLDAVRELQVVTAGGQAEFGRALGGYINILSRSASNHLHGTAYGFLRNQRFNAANALSGTTLPLTDGQYGASLGGPLRPDRTFVFGNFEQQRLRTDGVITVTPANAAAIDARLRAVGYTAPLLPVVATATTQFPTTLHTDVLFTRLDHRFSANDQLYARYTFYGLSSLNARGAGSTAEVSNGTSVFDTTHTLALSNIATLTPHLFNETRAQFVHDILNAPPNDPLGPAVTISGVASFGRSTSSPTARYNTLFELVDNLVLEHGAHTVKTGADFLSNDLLITFPQSLRGAYTFSSLANFLTGIYNNAGFTQNFGNPTVSQTNPNLGLYAQDEWQLGPTLTLNLGLRYDLQFLHTIATDINNVSPRLGLAWSPFPNHRTVLRASYGLFYDRVPLRALANALLSAGNTTDPAQATLLSYTFSPGQINAPIFPAIASTPPTGALINYSTVDPHVQNAYSEQASLGLEQQLFAKTTLGLSYQHLRGLHLLGVRNTNINPNGTRPDPTRGNIKQYSSAYDSTFDGLELSLVQRPSLWATARLSYTWSHALDDLSEFFFSSAINNFDLQQDRSRSDDDQRHRLTASATLTSPLTPAHSLAAHLTHGWALGGILTYTSRLPFNIVTGTTTLQQTTQRPCLGGYTLTGTNPCTEALPGAVLGRNAGNGFDNVNLNARLSRTVRLTHRLQLETLAEAYNALNHRNYQIPNATWGSGAYPSTHTATFGQPTAVADPRNLQLGVRFTF